MKKKQGKGEIIRKGSLIMTFKVTSIELSKINFI